MPRFDVTALKLQIPLVDLIAQHGIELKPNGPELIALCPFHGENTPSFTVEPDKGVSGLYYCHGCGEGGDQVAFLSKLLNLDAKQSIAKLAEIVGGEPINPAATPSPVPRGTSERPAARSPWVKAPAPPPPNEPAPKSLRKQDDGVWREFPVVRAWPYFDAAGELVAYDCRIEPQPGHKDIIPVLWRLHSETGEIGWRQGSLPKPRTLYGAELLAKHPGRQVIVVEGCKTADAARVLFADMPVVVVSWMGGGKAVRFADWGALAGRKVVIWPDCDSQRDKQTGEFKPYAEQAGVSAAVEIAGLLEPHGAQCRVVRVPLPGGEWADGYDLADALAEGRDTGWATAYLRQNLRTVEEIQQIGVGEAPRHVEPTHAPQHDSEPPRDEGPPPAERYEEGAPASFDGPGRRDEPFRFLGWDRLTAYYLPDNSEQVIDLTASGHTKNNLIALAPLQYWEDTFPSSKKGADCVDWTMAINSLVQRSQATGIYDPDLVRGRGAWWEDGKWAVHLGNRVIIEGKSYKLREAPTRYVYEKAATMHIQFEDPLATNEAVKLVKICERLRWLRPISGKLLAGWVFLAPICGAIDWRPHIWITGGAGSGKSTVMKDVIGRCLKGICLQVEGDTTEAGIRQSLVHDARPVVFDEFESERRKAVERVEDVLAMVTRASSESDAQLLKGSGDGKAQGFRTRAMFAFSSIAVSLKQFAAATRVTVLDLYSEPETEAGQEKFKAMMAELYDTLRPEYIQRLQARAVHLIPIIRQNAQTFSEAAALAMKSRRMGDQIGTLLAGVYALHSSKPITRADAVEWIRKQNWDDVSEVADGKDEQNCASHLLSYQLRIDTQDGPTMRSLAEMVQRAAGWGDNASDWGVTEKESSSTLRRHGIRVDGIADQAFISFASNHRELKRILQGTPWESSYGRTLLRVDGAEKHTPAKYGAVSYRGVRIPIRAVL